MLQLSPHRVVRGCRRRTPANPLDDPNADPFEIARQAAAQLAEATGVERHDIALTLGSGWGKAADLIGETTRDDPRHRHRRLQRARARPATSARLRSVLLPSGKRALVIGARTHFYEGHGVRRVVHSVRTAAAAGATTMILTNGAGGIKDALDARHPRADQRPHQPHRGLPARGRDLHRPHRPLLEAPARARPRRSSPASTTASTCSSAARTTRPRPRCRWRRRSAATSSGMSTALEAIAARQAGMEILGFSLITNLAAGISADPAQSHRGARGRSRRRAGDQRPARPRGGRAVSALPTRSIRMRWPRRSRPRGRGRPRTRMRSPAPSSTQLIIAAEAGDPGVAPDLVARFSGAPRLRHRRTARRTRRRSDADEPRARGPGRRGARGVPARAGTASVRRHRLRRPPQLGRLRPRHRRAHAGRRRARDPAAAPAADSRAGLRACDTSTRAPASW